MHEASLMRDLVAQMVALAKNESAERVTEVTVWLGALSHMSADHFCEHFERLAEGTVGDGAKVVVIHSDDASDPNAQGIILKSIEIEEADAPLHDA